MRYKPDMSAAAAYSLSEVEEWDGKPIGILMYSKGWTSGSSGWNTSAYIGLP